MALEVAGNVPKPQDQIVTISVEIILKTQDLEIGLSK